MSREHLVCLFTDIQDQPTGGTIFHNLREHSKTSQLPQNKQDYKISKRN